MKRPQFRIRTLLVTMVFVALLVGWWADRREMHQRIQKMNDTHKAVVGDMQAKIKTLENPLPNPHPKPINIAEEVYKAMARESAKALGDFEYIEVVVELE